MYAYTLSKEDALTLLRYLTKTRTNGIGKTNKTLLWFCLYFLVLAGISFFIGEKGATGILILFILYYVIVDKFFKKVYYNKYFKKILDADLNGMVNSPIQLEITAEYLRMTDQAGDYQYKLTSIVIISEIPGYFMVKLNNGSTLIIPKRDNNLETDIRKMISDHQLPTWLQLDWKW